MERKILIVNEGCAIFPHNTIHTLVSKNGTNNWNEQFTRHIPESWFIEFIPKEHHVYHADSQDCIHRDFMSLFTKNNYSWNKFRSLGYYTGTLDKTGFFTEEEYKEFEDYSDNMGLKIV